MCEEMIKNPYRREWASVYLDAMHDNLRQIAACRKNDAGIIAVIKADGYGHGAVMLAREMDEIPEVIGNAVATEEEAVLLADAGIKKPAMVRGYTFPEAYEEMALRGVHATVCTDQMLEDMNCAAQKAGQGNGDLNGGEKARRLFRQLTQPLRSAVAVLRQLFQLQLVHRNDGDLRAGKNGVDRNQYNLNKKLPPKGYVQKEFLQLINNLKFMVKQPISLHYIKSGADCQCQSYRPPDCTVSRAFCA